MLFTNPQPVLPDGKKLDRVAPDMNEIRHPGCPQLLCGLRIPRNHHRSRAPGFLQLADHICRQRKILRIRTAKHDQIVPPAYSENLVPDAKTIELNSGHLIFLEKPVELASAILSFCQWQAGAVS